MSNAGVKIDKLNKDLGDFAIVDVSITVNDRDYFMVLGPTGAGKTILLETIAGIHRPDSGKLYINGGPVNDVPPEKREVGFVYQDYALFPHLTVTENVLYGLRARGITDPEEKAEEVIDLLDLTPLKDRYPKTLSGGESQKTAVARAIAYEPNLLLLDEPTAALDPQTKEAVRGELRNVHDELEITTLHVTHDQSEAKILGDRICVLMEGRVKQTGTVEEVFTAPIDEVTANFVGVENVLDGEIKNAEENLAEIDVGEFTLYAVTDKTSGKVKAYIRPEDIFISEEPTSTTARNNVKGKVVSVTHLGQVYRVTVDTGLS
ncbi:MAG: ABC transporter ATP-binding protein, partial [Candidatus Bipolaricaulota bacterium]